MTKQILAYKDILHGGYAVMVVWTTGNDISDIKRIDDTYKFDCMDDVRKMAEALCSIIDKWGDEECMNA